LYYVWQKIGYSEARHFAVITESPSKQMQHFFSSSLKACYGYRRLAMFILLFGSILCISNTCAKAATVRWDGGAGTSAWGDANNWSSNALPLSTDDVILDNTLLVGPYSVVMNGLGYQIRSLKVGYAGNANTITLTITGGGSGDNLRLGGAPGADLMIDDGGVIANQSTANGNNNRGIEFVNAAIDSWTMVGTSTYLHQQNAGTFLNVAAANASFASTSTFELRSGLNSTWGGSAASSGLTVIKQYGNLKFNPISGLTLNLRVATDSLLVTGNLTVFNSNLTLTASDNTRLVRVHVRGNVTVNDAKLYASSGTSGSRIVVDGNVTTSGATARVSAATSSGNPTGVFVVGGNLNAYYAGLSTNEKLIFWRPGSSATSLLQPVAGSSFKAIEVRKKVALDADITLSGAADRLFVYSSGTFLCNGHNVTGNGQFSLVSGATLHITSADGITSSPTLAGNIRTLGLRAFHTGATYWYTGNAVQITGTGLPATVGSLGVAKTSASGVVTLSQAVTVNQLLTLSTGLINLDNFDLTLAAAATISGASSSSFVQTGPTVLFTGELVRPVPATNVAVEFPVGTSSYTPAALSQSAGGTADNFHVRIFNGAFDLGTSGEAYAFNSVNRTWLVSESVVGGSDVSLTLQWGTAEEQPSFTRLNTRIRHFTGGTYDSSMPESAASGTDPYTLTRTGITSFSPFMVGDGTPPLPVELVRFKALRQGESVRLEWATASEKNNDRFEIERTTSGDPRSFRSIGRVKGGGTTNTPQKYQFLDQDVPLGSSTVYYRLKQVDTDGKISYSDIEAVSPGKRADFVTVFPNPAAEQLHVTVSSLDTKIVILDQTGRLVIVPTIAATADDHSATRVLNVRALPTGTYFVQLLLPNGTVQQQAWVKTN
jgi:hypothetical protein